MTKQENKIYVYFGEFGFLNRFIINSLESVVKKQKMNILTIEDYGKILKAYFKDDINIVLPTNDLYILYRRYHHGNPGSITKDKPNLSDKNSNRVSKYSLASFF